MRKFVLDESVQGRYKNALHEYCINARFLYYLNGDKETWGQSDDHLIQVAKKFGFVIITTDRGLVINALLKNMAIIYVTPTGRYYEFPALAHVFDVNELGRQRNFGSADEHLQFLGMEKPKNIQIDQNL